MRVLLLLCLILMLPRYALGNPLISVQPQAEEAVSAGIPVPVDYVATEVTFEDRMTVRSDITELDFGKYKVRRWADVAPFLRQLPFLTKCDIYGTYIRPAQAHALAAEFPQIEFGWTFRLGGNGCLHVLRTDDEVFSTLHHAGAEGHDSDEFSALQYCKHIKAIDLGHNRVTDISWLSGLKDLRVLILAVNEIEDISPLKDLDLQYLELFSNSITDLTPLSGMPHLMDLNIGFNQITDLTPLTDLPALERLWLFSAGSGDWRVPVPQADIDMLLKAHPGLLLDNRSTPAQGGWRAHPRYYVVRDMFSQDEYMPFE